MRTIGMSGAGGFLAYVFYAGYAFNRSREEVHDDELGEHKATIASLEKDLSDFREKTPDIRVDHVRALRVQDAILFTIQITNVGTEPGIGLQCMMRAFHNNERAHGHAHEVFVNPIPLNDPFEVQIKLPPYGPGTMLVALYFHSIGQRSGADNLQPPMFLRLDIPPAGWTAQMCQLSNFKEAQTTNALIKDFDKKNPASVPAFPTPLPFERQQRRENLP
jgi:hypothetical protein